MNGEAKFITRNQAAKSCGITNKCFNYLIIQEPFVKYLMKEDINNILVNTDVIPLIREYYETHVASFHYYNSNQEYIPVSRAAQMLNKSYRELVEEIWSGTWADIYIEVR